jgi:hypothetical protein
VRVLGILVFSYVFIAFVLATLLDDLDAPLPECANETDCPLGGDGFHTYDRLT